MPYKDREKRLEYHRKYMSKYSKTEKWKNYKKKYDKLNKEKMKMWREKNKDSIRDIRRRSTFKNRVKIREYGRMWREKNKDKERARKLRWILKGKRKEYENKRRYTNMNFRIKQILYRRIHHAIKDNHKPKRTMELIGCSIEKFLDNLESRFDDEMSWGNYGLWHMDHIIPCASFDLSKEENQKKCFHYSNLQPLWAKDNFSKGCKV